METPPLASASFPQAPVRVARPTTAEASTVPVADTVTLTSSAAAPVAPATAQGAAQRPPVGGNTSDDDFKILDTAAVASAVGSQLKNGESVTFTADGRTILQVKKQGMTTLQGFTSLAADAVHAMAAEASNVVSQDPAFAFQEAALLVQQPVYSGVSSDLTFMADQAFLAMIRTVSTALDLKKAFETWKAKHTTPADKFVDSTHVATDMLGIGGAVARFVPGGHAVSLGLTVAGVVGDVASFGYHVMKYFRERGRQYEQQEKAAAALAAAPHVVPGLPGSMLPANVLVPEASSTPTA